MATPSSLRESPHLASSGPIVAAWSRLEGNLVCKGLCQESCESWVCTQKEGAAIEAAAGKPVASGACPYLQQGRCSIYEVRPTICRLWGQVESMPCPHGCRPRRMLGDEEAMELVHGLGAAIWSPWPDVEQRHKMLDAWARRQGIA